MTPEQVQHVLDEFRVDNETAVTVKYGHDRSVTGTSARLQQGLLYLSDDDEYLSSPIAIDVASIQMIARLRWPDSPVKSDSK